MDDISYLLEAKPEPTRTMASKTRKTVNRLECKQLHLNHVVQERPQEEETYQAQARSDSCKKHKNVSNSSNRSRAQRTM